jgi:hypothetical protein
MTGSSDFHLEGAAYSDSFDVRLPPVDTPLDAPTLARALAASVPRWLVLLLRVRNRLVRLIGVRPPGSVPTEPSAAAMTPGTRLLFFHVFAAADDQVVLGEDDAHLDYRLVIRVDREMRRASAATLVRVHGVRGRLYFAVVGPYHRLIMPLWLRSAAAGLRAADARGGTATNENLGSRDG